MALILNTDLALTLSDTLQRSGETEENGMRIAEYNNLNASGQTLATAKAVTIGVRKPKDTILGIAAAKATYKWPLASRADGSVRFVSFTGTLNFPADADLTERTVSQRNVYSVFSSTEWSDAVVSFKTAI